MWSAKSAAGLIELIHLTGVQTGEMQCFIAIFFVGLYGSFKIRTFFMVGLHIGTNSPAVSLNYLLAEAILKSRQREIRREILASCNHRRLFLTSSA
jgi:hypothetical protein